MGTKPQIFSAIRANFRGLVDSVALYTQGYRKVLRTSRLYFRISNPTVFSSPRQTRYLSYLRGRKAPNLYYPRLWETGLPLARTPS
jgi:hypothetical protein